MGFMPLSVLAEGIGEDDITVAEAVYLEYYVTDLYTEEAIVGAIVYLSDTRASITKEAKTNEVGYVKFDEIPKGTYNHEVTYDGYWPVDGKIEINANMTLEIELEKMPETDETLKVENLKAVPGDGKVTLSWDSSEGLTGYEIYIYEGTELPDDLNDTVRSH